RAGGNLEVKHIGIDRVPPPGERLAVRLEARAGKRRDRARRGMATLQPFGVDQREGAGGYRQGEVRLQNTAGRLARIHLQGGGRPGQCWLAEEPENWRAGRP